MSGLIKENMKEVSRSEFFATVGQMNVHPQVEPHVTHWKTPMGRLVGQSTPGYMVEGPKKYYVADDKIT